MKDSGDTLDLEKNTPVLSIAPPDVSPDRLTVSVKHLGWCLSLFKTCLLVVMISVTHSLTAIGGRYILINYLFDSLLNQVKLEIWQNCKYVILNKCIFSYIIVLTVTYYLPVFIWGSINNLGFWHCRCETEEQNTRRLEQQVALLRESKRKADESSMELQAEFHRSMTELQEMHREFEVTKCTANACYGIFFCGFLSSLPTHLSACFTVPSSFYLSVFLSHGTFPSVCTVSCCNLFYFNVCFCHPHNKNKMLLYNDSLTEDYTPPHKTGRKKDE